MWLEMSRDEEHGGGGWGFAQSLWSPARKQAADGRESGGRWPFWEALLRVRAGDQVLHLRGAGDSAAFVGRSSAATDGFVTIERPPLSGPWGYASSFYRVLLRDYEPFPTPVRLRDVFHHAEPMLRAYFIANRARPAAEKKILFYVIQSGRLQCLNGASLSEVDDQLLTILLGGDEREAQTPATPQQALPLTMVDTGVRVRELRARAELQRFSAMVRESYGARCAFPGCPVDERALLVGSQIARGADAPALRGDPANGICWCLLHDRAFELGLFTLSPALRVVVNHRHPLFLQGAWCQDLLLPGNGEPLRAGAVPPSLAALHHHWERIGMAAQMAAGAARAASATSAPAHDPAPEQQGLDL
jgi:putative restriction endonuclease